MHLMVQWRIVGQWPKARARARTQRKRTRAHAVALVVCVHGQSEKAEVGSGTN